MTSSATAWMTLLRPYVFDDSHFKADLQYEDAVPMLKRLQEAGRAEGLVFGVKLTNTFPVDITRMNCRGRKCICPASPYSSWP